jgi:hypothetical protein
MFSSNNRLGRKITGLLRIITSASNGNSLLTFRDKLSVPSSRVNIHGPLKTETRRCPETSIKNYHYSLCNTSEDRSSHLLRGGSLKPRNILDSFECDVEILRCK